MSTVIAHAVPRFAATKKIRVLVAEDDADMRKLLQVMLGSRGYEVVGVADGVELLSRIQESTWNTAEHGFDVIIADVNLGDFTSPEMIASMYCSGFNTPTILITADPGAEQAVRSLGVRPAAFFRKPLDLWKLMRAVGLIVSPR